MNTANAFLECLFKLKDMVMDKGIFFLLKNAILIFIICSVYPNMHGLLSSVQQKM